MARTQASRKYQLTINNPADHGFTREVLHNTLAGLKSCIYWCMCDEIGLDTAPLYIQSKCNRRQI